MRGSNHTHVQKSFFNMYLWPTASVCLQSMVESMCTWIHVCLCSQLLHFVSSNTVLLGGGIYTQGNVWVSCMGTKHMSIGNAGGWATWHVPSSYCFSSMGVSTLTVIFQCLSAAWNFRRRVGIMWRRFLPQAVERWKQLSVYSLAGW